MTDFESKVNARIISLANESGFTQREIADGTGISPSKLSKILNPEKYNVTTNVEDVANLAKFFSVPTDYLLTGAEFGDIEAPDLDEKLDNCDSKTAVLALADLMILAPFKYLKFADGSLHLIYTVPDPFIDGDARAGIPDPWFSFNKWEHYVEQFGNLAASELLSNSEKHSLIKKRVEKDIPAKIDSRMYGGNLVDPEDGYWLSQLQKDLDNGQE